MTIKELRATLATRKRELRSLLRAAGSDLGCDGTGVEAAALREEIADLRWQIETAQHNHRIRRLKRACGLTVLYDSRSTGSGNYEGAY